MPSSRQPIPEIQSWTPALDARAVESGAVFVLAGKNYYFDAQGPRSGFGAVCVSGGALALNDKQIQSIQLNEDVIILTDVGAYNRKWSQISAENDQPPSVESWNLIQTWSDIGILDSNRTRWTGAYVGFGAYVCHPARGLFQYSNDQLIPFSPTGVSENPLAITECQSRLIVLDQLTVAWSSAQTADDLTPSLGGAGFQVIAEFVPGEPLAVTSFEGGFLVWTTQGVMVAEFIGGEAVFRFDRVQTQQLILNENSWCALPSGETAIVTQQGIFVSNVSNGLVPLSAEFNEFLRDRYEFTSDLNIRLDYFLERDQLFVQVSDSSVHFTDTFVLNMKIQKWGQFSRDHLGMIRIDGAAGRIGYATPDGFVYEFSRTCFIEDSNGAQQPLDSFVDIGYIRPASGAPTADIQFEIQELILSVGDRLIETNIIEEDWNGPLMFIPYNIGFNQHDKDYNDFGVDYYDVDYNLTGVSFDANDAGDDTDYNDSVANQRDFDYNDPGRSYDFSQNPSLPDYPSWWEDWGDVTVIPLSEEDWGGTQSFYDRVTYGLQIQSTLDGWNDPLTVTPSLAIRTSKTDLWTLFSHGHHQKIILSANQVGQNFHLTHAEITVNFAGQIS